MEALRVVGETFRSAAGMLQAAAGAFQPPSRHSRPSSNPPPRLGHLVRQLPLRCPGLLSNRSIARFRLLALECAGQIDCLIALAQVGLRFDRVFRKLLPKTRSNDRIARKRPVKSRLRLHRCKLEPDLIGFFVNRWKKPGQMTAQYAAAPVKSSLRLQRCKISLDLTGSARVMRGLGSHDAGPRLA